MSELRDVYYWGLNRLTSSNKSVIKKATKLKILSQMSVKMIAAGPTQVAIIDYKDDLYMLGK